jgi:drug/metabolite transporter (DMT)-like permease
VPRIGPSRAEDPPHTTWRGEEIATPSQARGTDRAHTALNATLIQALAPLRSGLLAALLIAESTSRYQFAGAVVALLGVLVLMARGSLTFRQDSGSGLGDLVILVAVTLWSLYTVLGRRVTSKRSVLWATGLSTILGVPFLLVAMVLERQILSLRLTPALILAAVYMGMSPTVIGFLSWNAGVRRLGPSGAMAFYNTLPLYGALLASLFLGEEIGLATVAGGALMIGGGMWAARAQARAARAASLP